MEKKPQNSNSLVNKSGCVRMYSIYIYIKGEWKYTFFNPKIKARLLHP